MMTLHPIEYKEGIIWVDKQITNGCLFHIYGRIEKCLKVEQNRVYTTKNEFYHLFTMRGMEILSEQLCERIIAQSSNLSLPDIPYVEIEENIDIEHLASKSLQDIHKHTTLCTTPKEENIFLQGVNTGYNINSTKKYTEEDLRTLLSNYGYNPLAGYWFNHINQDKPVNIESIIQSLQPKIKSIKIEAQDEYQFVDGVNTFIRSTPVTYQKDGKTYLKVKKVNYGYTH